MSHEIALVTGGNRGLGFETARQLALRGAAVLLGSRDPRKGDMAARRLLEQNAEALPVILDVADPEHVKAAAEKVRKSYGRLDILVNNAGLGYNEHGPESAHRTIEVNVYGAMHMADEASPLMEPGGRIVNVSSGLGKLSYLGPSLRARFSNPDPTRAEFLALLGTYEHDVNTGRAGEAGWPDAYSVSKMALNVFTRILARELEVRGILVNAIDPGWVRTDMGGSHAPRSVEEGAKSIVWGATLPPDGPTGGFFRDGAAISW